MVNYGKGKVYKIWSPLGNKIYIGSTTKEYLSQRMVQHRSDYKTKTKNISSFILFEEYGFENCKIELLEAKECNSKDELLQLEGKYIRDLVCVNKNIPNRTLKEWMEDNKKIIQEKSKIYAETHKEHKKEYMKEYAKKEEFKEQKRIYYENHKDESLVYQQKYREENKEKILNKKKEYYQKNKEDKKIKQKQYYLKKKMEQKSE